MQTNDNVFWAQKTNLPFTSKRRPDAHIKFLTFRGNLSLWGTNRWAIFTQDTSNIYRTNYVVLIPRPLWPSDNALITVLSPMWMFCLHLNFLDHTTSHLQSPRKILTESSQIATKLPKLQSLDEPTKPNDATDVDMSANKQLTPFDPQLEPLLRDNPSRFVIFPIQYPDIWQMYKKVNERDSLKFKRRNKKWKKCFHRPKHPFGR